jgi:hypothetical protein
MSGKWLSDVCRERRRSSSTSRVSEREFFTGTRQMERKFDEVESSGIRI